MDRRTGRDMKLLNQARDCRMYGDVPEQVGHQKPVLLSRWYGKRTDVQPDHPSSLCASLHIEVAHGLSEGDALSDRAGGTTERMTA